MGRVITSADREAATHLILNTKMAVRRIAALTGLGVKTVQDMVHKLGATGREIERNDLREPRPAPEDFAAVAVTESSRELCRRYNAGRKLVARWREETGAFLSDAMKREIHGRPHRKPASVKPVVVKPPKAPKRFITGLVPQAVAEIKRDMSRAGLAASFMQRDGWVCHRCTADGRAMPGTGSHWRLGRLVVTDAELIERAERKGFGSEKIAA